MHGSPTDSEIADMTATHRPTSSRSQLITAVQHLLQKEAVETQEDIRLALRKQGIIVNQAMISRILHKVGAVKMDEGEQTVYRLQGQLAAVTPKNSLSQLILQITHNEMLIVIQTTPGSAQLVARLLDQRKEMGILGTVAGDDTIFIAPKSTKNMQAVIRAISSVLLG